MTLFPDRGGFKGGGGVTSLPEKIRSGPASARRESQSMGTFLPFKMYILQHGHGFDILMHDQIPVLVKISRAGRGGFSARNYNSIIPPPSWKIS